SGSVGTFGSSGEITRSNFVMEQSVRLQKPAILELLCRLFQAERAVAGLGEIHWLKLINYYDTARVTEMKKIIETIRGFLPLEAKNMAAVTTPPEFSAAYWRWWRKVAIEVAGPFVEYCWPLINRLKSHWKFTVTELHYILNRLEAFLQMLRLPAFPGYEVVVSLRMELTACRSIIEGRCRGLREVRRILSIEYFNKAASLQTIPLSDIINPRKKSAA